jgi:hypothetical protein
MIGAGFLNMLVSSPKACIEKEKIIHAVVGEKRRKMP